MSQDDRKASVTREMEVLGPEAMTRSLRAFPQQPWSAREHSCRCVLGYAGGGRGGDYTRMKLDILGVSPGEYSALEKMYEDGNAELLHIWILEWLELNRIAAPVPVPAPVPPIAADCPHCCQVEYGTTRHCADHCEEGIPF